MFISLAEQTATSINQHVRYCAIKYFPCVNAPRDPMENANSPNYRSAAILYPDASVIKRGISNEVRDLLWYADRRKLRNLSLCT